MNETTSATISKVIISEITTTSTTTKSHDITLPTLYTPLASRASSTDYIDQEHTQSFTIQIFTPLPTITSNTVKYDPDATLPPSFHPLSSRAPRKFTSSTITTTTTTTTTTTSSPTLTAAQSLNKSSLSSGQLAGIIIGSILGALLLLYILYVLCWTRRKSIRNKNKIDCKAHEYADSIHLPYHFNYPHPTDSLHIPDESITSQKNIYQ